MDKQITKRTFLIIMSLTLLLVLVGSTSAFAQEIDEADQDVEIEEIVHQVPKYPIIVDGVRYKSEEITRFNGQPLIMFANEQVEKEGIIYAFTTEEKAQKYAASLSKTASSVMPLFSRSTTIIYRDINYSTMIDSGSCGEAWNLGSSPNQASSVITAHCAAGYTKLYDDFNLGGASLWLTTGFDVADLRVYGWNDRANSYKVDL